jgi:DNA/RNA endonuclease YhcR with UshA esterase domain
LDFDQPYPNTAFKVLMWGEDRAKFGTPETRFPGQQACATGVIESYRGKAEMIVREPSQLRPNK